MGPLWKIFTDNRDIILMAPGVFLAAIALGWLAGWMVIRLVYNQRLAHQQDMIAKLRGILEEKLPASFLPQPKRSKLMSFPLIFGGLGLAFIGLSLAAVGAIWQMRTQASTQIAQDKRSIVTLGIGSPPSPDQIGMKWNEIFGTTRGGGSMISLFLDGNGGPSKSIKLTDAFLESAITGEVIKMKMGTSSPQCPSSIASVSAYEMPARTRIMAVFSTPSFMAIASAVLKPMPRMSRASVVVDPFDRMP
jgi:hypothetical protein